MAFVYLVLGGWRYHCKTLIGVISGVHHNGFLIFMELMVIGPGDWTGRFCLILGIWR